MFSLPKISANGRKVSIKQANTLDLTKKVNSTGYSEGATRGMIAQVLFTTHLKYLYTKTTVTTGLQQRKLLCRTT